MSSQPANRSLPARQLPAGPLERAPGLPGGSTAFGLPGGEAPPVGLPVPRRLARLGSVLASFSLALVLGGFAGWALLGTDLTGDAGERGPWPLVLGAGFCLGLLGAGCGLVSLAIGTAARRQAVGALCLSLVAPVTVGILALALFFSTTSSF